LLFNELFRSAKRALHASGLIEGASGTPVMAPVPTPITDPLPPIDLPEAGDQLRDTFRCLLQMSQSRYVDVKAQAVAAICDMTKTNNLKTTSMILAEGGVAALVVEFTSKFEDVYCPAITAVANLAFRRDDVCAVIMHGDNLKNLLRLASSQTLQVVRETARCLSNLAACVGSRMDTDELRAVVRTLMCSDDSRARTHVHELLKTLRITAV